METLTFLSGGRAVSHEESNAPYCLASMQIQPCWLMLGVVSARMLMSWQVCSMLNKKKTGMALKANTASQMKARMYVTMINCWNTVHSLLGHSNVAQEKGFSVMNVVPLNKPWSIIHDSLEKSWTPELFTENHSGCVAMTMVSCLPPPCLTPPCSLLGWGIGRTGCSWTLRRTAWRHSWRRNPRPTERFHRGRKKTPGRRSRTGSTRYWDTKINQLKQETGTRNVTIQII